MRNMWVGARALRGRGEALELLLARPDRPSRCTLPITALRVMPPSSAAIWLAERPSDHSFFNSSTRSSVHDMLNPPQRCRCSRDGIPHRVRKRAAPQHSRITNALEDRPPHEMSCLTIKRLQYGGSRAQESRKVRPHIPV